MYQYMRQCDFFGIVKKRLSRKMQIFCRKVKIANYVVSNEDINMRMVGNGSVTHFNQRLPVGFFSSRTNRKKVTERQSFVIFTQNCYLGNRWSYHNFDNRSEILEKS